MPLVLVGVGAITFTITAVMVYMAVVAPSAPTEWSEPSKQTLAHHPPRRFAASASSTRQGWNAQPSPAPEGYLGALYK